MNDLAINIEYLLLTRNSVIVPGLGAFTTRTFASQWLEEEEIFLPPVRHIRFNADVFQDPDEIFLHSLIQIYSVSEEEAQSICDQMVSEFHKTLVTEGSVDFGSIGLFTLEDDAEITMSPYECGVTSPDYYGLDTLHFPLLSSLPDLDDTNVVTENTKQDSVDLTENAILHQKEDTVESQAPSKGIILPKGRTYVADSKHIVIRLNRAFVHYSMVTAASILLFFLLSPNVMNNQAATEVKEATTNIIFQGSTSKGQSKGSNKCVNIQLSQNEKLQNTADDSLKFSAASNETTAKNESSLSVVSSDADNSSLSASIPDETKVVEKSAVDGEVSTTLNELRGSYSIVLASAVSKKNAKAFVERLQEKDVHAIIYDNGKMLRVVIDGFASQADAYNVNNYLHNLDKDLSSTWVMKN